MLIMDEAQLERRLTLMEANAESASKMAVLAVQSSAEAATARHAQVLDKIADVRDEVTEVKNKVQVQNGRVGKLEAWRVQATTLYGAILALAPFVFYGLLRAFGQ